MIVTVCFINGSESGLHSSAALVGDHMTINSILVQHYSYTLVSSDDALIHVTT